MSRPAIWLFVVSNILLIGRQQSSGINHWVQLGNRIIPKYDTHFYLHHPGNLPIFLEQITHSEFVEKSYQELLRARQRIANLLHESISYGEELLKTAKCAVDYLMMEKRIQHLEPSYLKRLGLAETVEGDADGAMSGEPLCSEVAQTTALPTLGYENLDILEFDHVSIGPLAIPEEDDDEDQTVRHFANAIRRFSMRSLRQNPQSWKSFTMGSYYWRLKGKAKEAIKCARLAVVLAPMEFKDIPLLSLGTTLFSGGYIADAVVLLRAAVEHGPLVAENHLALALALAMRHEFAESLRHFDEAERLDAHLSQKSFPVRSFVSCLDALTTKTDNLYGYVENMKGQLLEMKRLKSEISQKHEKLIQQQVPLNARNLEDVRASEELSRRGQYCTARAVANSAESVLVCDFYSDTHMRLESKDLDIDTLEREFLGGEEVMRQVADQFSKQLRFDKTQPATTKHGGKD